MLVICRGLVEGEAEATEGPPWPLREGELIDAATGAGLAVEGEVSSFEDEAGGKPVRRMRALFRRAS
jgi:hypothetical protein